MEEPGARCSPNTTPGIVSSLTIRKGRYKYNYYPGYPPQLFNLADDPDEVSDLSADLRYRDVMDALHAELLSILDPDAVAAAVKESEFLSGLEAVRRFEFK